MRKLIGILVAGLISTAAFAADTSVPNMTAGGAMSDTDLIYCAQSGGTTDRKCTGAQVKTYANTSAVRATTTTSEAIINSDQNKLVTFSNAAAVACTIAQAGSGGNFAAGWAVSLKNLGAGTVTCTPTTSTVDGAANFTLTTGQGVDLYSDGTNYFTQPGKGGGGTVTTTGSPASGNLSRFSGASSITNDNLSGDCSTSGTLATTCQMWGFPYRSGNFHILGSEYAAGTASNASTFTANVARCYPAILRAPGGTVSSIGVRINTTAVSGIDLAVYLNNPTTARPTGTPLFSTLNLSGAVGAFVSGAVSYAFTQNLRVWGCIVSNNTTVTTNGMTPTLGFTSLMGSTANTIQNGTAIINGITFAQTQNTAWPDLTSPPTFTEVATITHSSIILGF